MNMMSWDECRDLAMALHNRGVDYADAGFPWDAIRCHRTAHGMMTAAQHEGEVGCDCCLDFALFLNERQLAELYRQQGNSRAASLYRELAESRESYHQARQCQLRQREAERQRQAEEQNRQAEEQQVAEQRRRRESQGLPFFWSDLTLLIVVTLILGIWGPDYFGYGPLSLVCALFPYAVYFWYEGCMRWLHKQFPSRFGVYDEWTRFYLVLPLPAVACGWVVNSFVAIGICVATIALVYIMERAAVLRRIEESSEQWSELLEAAAARWVAWVQLWIPKLLHCAFLKDADGPDPSLRRYWYWVPHTAVILEPVVRTAWDPPTSERLLSVSRSANTVSAHEIPPNPNVPWGVRRRAPLHLPRGDGLPDAALAV